MAIDTLLISKNDEDDYDIYFQDDIRTLEDLKIAIVKFLDEVTDCLTRLVVTLKDARELYAPNGKMRYWINTDAKS